MHFRGMYGHLLLVGDVVWRNVLQGATLETLFGLLKANTDKHYILLLQSRRDLWLPGMAGIHGAS